MTIKRGLKRVWILGSVLWGSQIGAFGDSGFNFNVILFVIGGLGIWWAIYWGISGFFSDEDESDEDK